MVHLLMVKARFWFGPSRALLQADMCGHGLPSQKMIHTPHASNSPWVVPARIRLDMVHVMLAHHVREICGRLVYASSRKLDTKTALRLTLVEVQKGNSHSKTKSGQ